MGLEQIKVKLLGSYGSDLLIAQQAWLSTGKHEDGSIIGQEDIKKILEILITRKHTRPLEVVDFHFEVKWPISCDRQQQTHRTQTASIARSGRYGSAPMEFYIPDEMTNIDFIHGYRSFCEDAIDCYHQLINEYKDKLPKTRAREVFRDLLPQGMMTERKFKINLKNFIDFLALRRSTHAQKEIAYAANLMLKEVMHVCPITFSILMANKMLGDINE